MATVMAGEDVEVHMPPRRRNGKEQRSGQAGPQTEGGSSALMHYLTEGQILLHKPAHLVHLSDLRT